MMTITMFYAYLMALLLYLVGSVMCAGGRLHLPRRPRGRPWYTPLRSVSELDRHANTARREVCSHGIGGLGRR